MSQQQPPKLSVGTWGKLGLATGAVACALPLPLFGIQLPKLPAYEQGVLSVVYVASLLVCSVAASRRPLVGVLALPPIFFGVMCLACWWVIRR